MRPVKGQMPGLKEINQRHGVDAKMGYRFD